MSSAPIDAARDVFNDALELQPAARSEFLDRVCKDDAALRAEVERLLSAFKQAGEFLEPDARHTDSVAEDDYASLVGRCVGAFTISRVIGAGGMGVVYEAQQERPTRTVALKLMRRGIASRSALRRFEHESEILARLQHPGIAQVYDVGMHDDGSGGVPYFVMEYIAEARTLTDYARSENLGARQRLELFINVCDAVHHGHQKGVIHRDLKPGNVLIDASGQTKIIDFGVARATDSDIAVTTMQTDVGQLIGTLQYMSPEQIEADPHEIDVRSDVYALGVVLYELLCSKPPYDVSQARIYEATRMIREDSPTRPSTVDRALRGDLETIVLKALEKERERRYQSAADLGADIQRYLTNQPIMARPASTAYQIRTFARRNKTLVSGVVATFVVLVAGIIGVTAMFLRARNAETDAEQRADELELVVDFQEAQLADLDAMVMGERLRSAITAKRRAALELDLTDDAEIQRHLDALDQSLEGVNFTDVAMESVNENILAPALREIDERFAGQPLVQAQLLQSVASALYGLDLTDQALAPQEQALVIYRRELTDAHRDTIRTLKETSKVYEGLGRLDEAEQLARLAVENARRELGVEDRLTLSMLHWLGVHLISRAEEAESEQCLREVMEVGGRVLGDKDPLVISAMGDLAYAVGLQGDFAEAETLFREALRLREEVHGNDHLGTLWASGMLGGMLRYRDRLDEAAPYLRRSMEGYERVLGERHFRAFEAKHHMALLLRQVYERDADVDALEEARQIAVEQTRDERQIGAYMRPGRGWGLVNYARILVYLGDLEQAQIHLLEAEALLADTSVPIKNDDEFAQCTRDMVEAFVALYDARRESEPDAGYDAKAAAWRAKLTAGSGADGGD